MQYPEIEAYLVVFSLTDRQSFRYACDVLRLLRHHSRTDASVILVGNKSDLVRGRRVADDGQNHVYTPLMLAYSSLAVYACYYLCSSRAT